MKKLLIGLLAIGTLSAQASILEINGPLDATLFKAQVEDEKTHFETLGDLFKAGMLPDLKKISNIAWAGRCFFKNLPNTAAAGGFIIRPKSNNAGPIAKISYEAFMYTNDLAPDFYDKMDLKQMLQIISEMKFEPTVARIKTNSVEVIFSNSSYIFKSNLKVSGNYIINELLYSDPAADPEGKFTAGVRCYYFIPDLKH